MQHFDTINHGRITWYHSTNGLDSNQRKQFAKQFKILNHHIAATQKGKTPRPKISPTSNYTMLVLHIPYRPKNSNRLFICELAIFISKTNLITIQSSGSLEALNDYFSKTKSAKLSRERRLKHGTPALLTNILKKVLSQLEIEIDVQGEQVGELEKQLFRNKVAKKFIEQVSVIRYNQIIAYNALERQSRLLENYSNENNPLKAYKTGSNHKWNSIIETIQTFTYELNSDINHLEGLVKTFESLITYRTNETIKLLTIFSVILMPMTVISGIYGMNFLHIPLAANPIGFYLIILGMGLVAFIMALTFKLKHWI